MAPMRVAAFIACALSLAPLPQTKPAPGKDKKEKAPGPTLSWFDGSLEEAKAASKERNAPILIALLQEREGPSDEVREKVYKDPDFLKAASKMVLVLGLDAAHGETEGKDGKKVCKIFAGVSCDRHKELAAQIFRAFKEDGGINTPMHLLISAKGEEIKRFHDVFRAEDLIEPARPLLKKAVTTEEYLTVRSKLDEADKQLTFKEYASAWKLSQEILAKFGAGATATRAKEIAGKIDSVGKETVAAVAAMGQKGEFVNAVKEADGFIPRFAGSPIEALLKQERAKIAADPKAKEALVPYEMLLKAQELEKAGKKPEAMKAYKALAEKFPNTEEGREAKSKL